MTLQVRYTPYIIEGDEGDQEHIEITGMLNCACKSIEEYKNCPHVGSSLNPFPTGKYILDSPNNMLIQLDPHIPTGEFRSVKTVLERMTDGNIIFQQGTHRINGLPERIKEIWQDKSVTTVYLTEVEWHKLKKFNKNHPSETVYAQKLLSERIKEMK